MKRAAQIFQSVFDPWPSADKEQRDKVYAFARVRFFSGLIAALALPLYIQLIGVPTLVIWIAFAWAMVPLGLAFAPRLGASLDRAWTLSILNTAGLMTYMAFFTGGLGSFLIAWFVVIPVASSMSGNKKRTWVAIALMCLGLVSLYAGSAFNVMPVGQVLPLGWSLLFMLSTLAAMLYVGTAAMRMQRHHVQAGDQARASETMLRFLTDNARDMILHHHADGSLAWVSPASMDVLGYMPEEMLAFEQRALIHPADRKHVEIALARASHFGEDATIEFRMQHKDGAYIWIEMRCRAVSLDDQYEVAATGTAGESSFQTRTLQPESYEIIAVARDISAAKRYEQELIQDRELAEAGSRSKLHFLANVSHELRTPLSAINGFSDIMQREMFGPMDNEKYLEYSHLIHSSGHHLLELINDLLDMSKVEAGKYSLDHESIFFPVIIESCLRLVRLQLERAEVKLHVDLPQGLPRIEADPRACKQILLNLLSNAIKFTKPGGTITISMFMDEGRQVLEVCDSGVGIAAHDLERLGNPFEQAKGASSFVANDRSSAGTGLGLALVRSFTELHGGDFLISSEVGIGTKVQVSLPLVAPHGHDVDAPLPGIFEEIEPQDVGLQEPGPRGIHDAA